MPITLDTYTDYDSVRIALGMSTAEFTQAAWNAEFQLTRLIADIDSVDHRIDQKYLDLIEDDPEDYTPEEDRFVRAVRIFSTYAVATGNLTQSSMSGLKRIEDGKAKAERFDNAAESLFLKISSEYDRWRNNLIVAFEALGYIVNRRDDRLWFVAVSPTSDPVTGT